MLRERSLDILWNRRKSGRELVSVAKKGIGANHFKVYQSDNDPYVSLGNGKELAKQLGVDLTFIPNVGHLNAESGYTKFDLLLADINKIL